MIPHYTESIVPPLPYSVTSRILFVPGLRGHVSDHWQDLLARELPGSRTVQPEEAEPLSCSTRVRNLHREIECGQQRLLLVAHSAGVLIVAHWASLHPQLAATRIAGALLATPADLENSLPAGYPTLDDLTTNGWLPIPRARLPFPAILAGSENDPLARLNRIQALADDWGCSFRNLGSVGHLNPSAGFGPWREASDLIRELVEPEWRQV